MTTGAFGHLPTFTLEFNCDDFPATGVRVTSSRIDELLNGDYRAHLTLASDSEFDPHAALGADCEISFSRGGEVRRVLHGMIVRVEDLGETAQRHFSSLEVAPAFALLQQTCNSRIWQSMTVKQIIEDVLSTSLAPYGRTFDLGAVTRGDKVRDYCTQFRESDHAFVCRLLEEEGINRSYTHTHDGGPEVLTLHDAMAQYPKLEDDEIPIIEHNAAEAGTESIQSISHNRQLTVTSILTCDYDWTTPKDLLTELADGTDARGRERRIYRHQRRRYITDDLTQQASDALAASQLEGHTISGNSNVTNFVPGTVFTIFEGGCNIDGEYLLTRVTHQYSNDESGGALYHNSFGAMPTTAEYRPRRLTRKPRVHGPHTATVVGDDEIHTDEHGRVQVQFHWQEDPSYAANASCWIRCMQSWSGPGWGTQFIPRVGMEVVVEFLEGNPDRPLVTGTVYNGANDLPFTLPDHKTQSGWRTSSSPSSSGYNMLRFEDAAGNEEIHIHGQKDLTIVIENDADEEIRHDQSLHILNDRTKTVDHDERESIGNDRDIDVGSDHTETIGNNMKLAVGANHAEKVGRSKTVKVGDIMTLSVGTEFNIVCGGASLTMKSSGEIEIKGKTLYTETEDDTTMIGAMVHLNP